MRFYSLQDRLTGGYTSRLDPATQRTAERAAELLGPPPMSVLDLGAGGGQVAGPLLALGYAVTAVELNPHFCAYMRQSMPEAKVIQADILTCPQAQRFGGVACVGEVLAAQGPGNTVKLLARIKAWLAPGGKAVVEYVRQDFWARHPCEHFGGGGMVTMFHADPKGWSVLMNVSSMDGVNRGESETLHCHTEAGFAWCVKQAGLRVVQVEGNSAIDFGSGRVETGVPLAEAMRALAVLEAA